MRKALVVARWEFITTVTRGAFIFAVVAMPLFYGGMLGLAGVAGRSAATSNSRAPVAVVDGAHIIDLAVAAERAERRNRMRDDTMDEVIAVAARQSATAAALAREATAPTTPLVPYADVNSALDDLRASKVATIFALDPNYLQNGLITTYSRDGGIFSQSGDRQRQNQVADAIRASLIHPALSGDALDRAYAPATNVRRMVLDRTGEFHQSTDTTGLGPIAGSFGVFMLLTMAIFFSAGFLQQATIADRQNKMIEILWSSLEPDQLVLGKLLGLGGAGLLQISIYLALVILPGAALFSLFQVALLKLGLSVIFFVLGFLVFACLMIGTGMIGRTAQESAQLSTIWILFAAAPWFFIANIGAAPNGLLARALSFFPLTSPVAMMMRLSSADVPLPEVLGVIAVDSLAIYLIFKAAAKLFRASALMYGKRPTLPELMRWLRAA